MEKNNRNTKAGKKKKATKAQHEENVRKIAEASKAKDDRPSTSIGDHAKAAHPNSFLLGDKLESVAADDVQVGEQLFGWDIPDRVKQVTRAFPQEVRQLLNVVVGNVIAMEREAAQQAIARLQEQNVTLLNALQDAQMKAAPQLQEEQELQEDPGNVAAMDDFEEDIQNLQASITD